MKIYLIILLFLSFVRPGQLFASPSPLYPLGNLQVKNLMDGKSLSLELIGEKKAAVIVFLSVKCPCSASHLEHIKKLREEFPDFSFYGVHSNQDESALAAESFFRDKGLGMPIFHDEKAQVADKLGALKTPHAFVLNGQGEILFQGGLTNSIDFKRADHYYLQEALTQIRQGRNPDSQKARTVGCYISR